MATADAAAAFTIDIELNVADGLGVSALRQSVLTVFDQHDLAPEVALEGIDEGCDDAVAFTAQLLGGFALTQRQQQAIDAIGARELIVMQLPARFGRKVSLYEQVVYRDGTDLAFRVLGIALHRRAEIDLQPARQVITVVGMQHISDAALARLAIDPNNLLIGTPNIRRVDGQIGDFPSCRIIVPARQAFFDRVLVTARERSKHELTRIGMARVNGQLGAGLYGLDDFIHGGEIELRIHALAVQVHSHGDDVHVTRALAITHERALDAVRAGHNAQLRRRHAASAVIVRMQRDKNALAPRDAIAEPFDLVRVDVWRAHLHRCGQVDDGLALGSRLPHVRNGVADLQSEIELGPGEALRGVLEGPFRPRITSRVLLYEARAVHGNRLYAVAVEAKNLLTLYRGSGVVDMHNRAGCAL